MAFLDKTFCASSNCVNECGRKMTKAEENELDFRLCRAIADHGDNAIVPVSWAYFCDLPPDFYESCKKHEVPE